MVKGGWQPNGNQQSVLALPAWACTGRFWRILADLDAPLVDGRSQSNARQVAHTVRCEIQPGSDLTEGRHLLVNRHLKTVRDERVGDEQTANSPANDHNIRSRACHDSDPWLVLHCWSIRGSCVKLGFWPRSACRRRPLLICSGQLLFGQRLHRPHQCGGVVAHGMRDDQRLVGAIKELDGHEGKVGVADVLQVVNFVFSRPILFVPGFAGRVIVFPHPAVVKVLPSLAGGCRRPEII